MGVPSTLEPFAAVEFTTFRHCGVVKVYCNAFMSMLSYLSIIYRFLHVLAVSYLFIYLFIYLLIYLFIYSFIYLFIFHVFIYFYLFIHISICILIFFVSLFFLTSSWPAQPYFLSCLLSYQMIHIVSCGFVWCHFTVGWDLVWTKGMFVLFYAISIYIYLASACFLLFIDNFMFNV